MPRPVPGRSVTRLMEEAAHQPSYAYPWASLESDLERQGRDTLALVAYGSLVNPDSAALTLGPKSGRARRPVIAYGVRRIFNFPIPEGHTRYGPPVNPRAIAALNLRQTGARSDSINGVLLPVSIEDLPAMRDRERGYDLQPVACTDWGHDGAESFIGYVLVWPDAPTNASVEPHRRYYEVCRQGAAGLGPAFLEAWLRNTYLADGITPVERWEQESVQP